MLPHPWIVQAGNLYYAIVHVPALIAMLVWLFVRHRDRYPAVRNTLALLTGACLLIQLVPVMPPRLMASLGFVDTGHLYGQSVYTHWAGARPISSPPCRRCTWLGGARRLVVVTVSTSRWRWLVLAHPVLTSLVVVVTANHWWLDGVVAASAGRPAGSTERCAASDRDAVRIRGRTAPAGRRSARHDLDGPRHRRSSGSSRARR